MRSALALYALLAACASPGVAKPERERVRTESMLPQADAPAVRALCVGGNHACAQLAGGQVSCWGDNSWHQLSAAREAQFDTPRVVDLPAAASIACGGAETCARTANGEVHCRGMTPQTERLSLPGPATDLVLFEHGGCALLETRRVLCWNRPGAPRGNPLFGPDEPERRALWELKQASPADALVHRSGLADGVCVKQGGNMRCYEQLRQREDAPLVENAHDYQPEELRAAAPPGATSSAYGYNHGCALVRGAVQCWGAASQGQLGDGAKYLHPEPVRVAALSSVTRIDAGWQTCALSTDGVFCWGDFVDAAGRVSYLFAPRKLEPIPGPVLQLIASRRRYPGMPREFDTVRTRIRTAVGWWEFDEKWRKTKPEPAEPIARAEPRASAHSRDGACGVMHGGKLLCLRRVRAEETATSMTERLTFTADEAFVEASGLFQVDHIDHVCARTKSGQVACFAVDARKEPRIQVDGLAGLRDITNLSSEDHGGTGSVCALDGSGAVFCWGDGRYAQLGVEPPRGPFEPRKIQGLPPIAEISNGGTYVCGRTRTGDVHCWGSNREGNVPDGAPGSHKTPVSVKL